MLSEESEDFSGPDIWKRQQSPFPRAQVPTEDHYKEVTV